MEDHDQTGSQALLQRPWLPVCIGDRQLLAKSWFGDTAYHVLLTDTRSVWEERMDTAAIQARAQELNRRLRAPVKAFYSHLREVAAPCLAGEEVAVGEGGAQVSVTTGGDGALVVRLKSELAGLPFHWEFHLTPPPVHTVCTQLVRPLLAMSRLLHTQVERLGSLLARKDAEIQDYKENGAVLSRARLQTDLFDEQTFRDDTLAEVLPQVTSDPGDEGLGFSADLRELYSTVVAYGNRGKRKRPHSEGDSSEGSPLAADGQEAEHAAGHAPNPGEAASRVEAPQPAEEERGTERKTTAAPQPVPGSLAARPASARPKKKKAVGLFR